MPGKLRRKPEAPAADFNALLGRVRPEVERGLARVLRERLEHARAHGAQARDMVEALSTFCLRGGKRLRAGLVAVGYACSGQKSTLTPSVIRAGVALELLQAYFLIHDDWMDRDDVRRGGPAVHAAFRTKLKDEHLAASAAILTGDFASALALQTLTELRIEQSNQAGVYACFSRMQLDAVTGQQRDLLAAEDVTLTYALKTSSYTVLGPLELGARLGGAAPPVLRALARYASPTGLAFQLRDDLLNAFGEPSLTGKPFASDLAEGKRTWLVEYALGKVRGADRRALAAAWGQRNASLAVRRAALAILERSGARAATEARLAELREESLKAALAAPFPARARLLLQSAAHALITRQS
jgi:geranylgeranyl diphosphate synthase type I